MYLKIVGGGVSLLRRMLSLDSAPLPVPPIRTDYPRCGESFAEDALPTFRPLSLVCGKLTRIRFHGRNNIAVESPILDKYAFILSPWFSSGTTPVTNK
jgi:hypothetical protein